MSASTPSSTRRTFVPQVVQAAVKWLWSVWGVLAALGVGGTMIGVWAGLSPWALAVVSLVIVLVAVVEGAFRVHRAGLPPVVLPTVGIPGGDTYIAHVEKFVVGEMHPSGMQVPIVGGTAPRVILDAGGDPLIIDGGSP